MPRCPRCLSEDLRWLPVCTQPTLYSWTVARHTFSPAFPAPYTVGLVEFDNLPGIRLVSNIVDAEPSALTIGMALSPVFVDKPDFPMVYFSPRITRVDARVDQAGHEA